MSPGEWKGNNIPQANRVLILGESHYGDEKDVGAPVTYNTSSVVEEYLSHREPNGGSAKWDRFFDRIAECFGYFPGNATEFYNKVWFANYVPVFCGKGKANVAKAFMKEYREDYNNALFEFINENHIDTLVCFSKAVFWNLPACAKEDEHTYSEIELSTIGGRRNILNYYEYFPNVSHGLCDVVLNEHLKVYGIRHPSNRGGFDAKSVCEALSKEKVEI